MDVRAYLDRIGRHGPHPPTLATLRTLHLAHATSIPFENLDIQLGLPILLDADALEDKLVTRRRGGYCFEHNTLAMHALRAMGFDLVACEARVRLGATRVAPRTHMVLLVTVDGTRWLWDTGFGGDTLLEPLRLDGRAVVQGGATYRVVDENGLHVLQMEMDGTRTDLYAFVAESREMVDFDVANWYTSTHPHSHFVTTLTAQLRTADGWRVLRSLTYSVRSKAGTSTREIARTDLPSLLHEQFALDFPGGTRFRALDGSAAPDSRSSASAFACEE